MKLAMDSQAPPPDQLAWLERAQKIFAPAAKEASQANPLDELKKVLDVFGQAKGIFASEGTPAAAVAAPDNAEVWERIAINISNQVGGIIGALPQIILAFKTKGGLAPMPTAATPTAAASSAAAAFNPYDAAAMRAYVQSQKAATASSSGTPPATPAAAPTAQGATEPGSTTPPAQPANDVLGQVAMLVSQAFNCLSRGVDGRTCAQAYIDLSGELAFNSLVAHVKSAGVPVVLELAKSIPELSAQVIAYQEQLAVFISEFLEGPPEWDEAEGSSHGKPEVVA